MRSIMFDLETLHNQDPNCVILSLGAVSFDLDNPEVEFLDEFQAFFDYGEQLKEGRTKSTETVLWWKEQDEEVKKAQFSGKEKLADGLNRFQEWLAKQGEIEFYYAWNVSFDFPILQNALLSYGMKGPFVDHFWKRMCAATVGRQMERAMGQKWMVSNLKKSKFKEFGGAHDALTDSKVQVEVLKDLLTRE